MSKEKVLKNQQGFIALMSIIIISAILIVLVVIVSTSSLFVRFNVLDYENKKISVGLAEACAEMAMVNLAQDKDFNPAGECVSVGDSCANPARKKVCKICSITSSLPPPRALGARVTIETRAVYNQAYTNLRVQGNIDVANNNFSVTSWDELQSYSGTCTVP